MSKPLHSLFIIILSITFFLIKCSAHDTNTSIICTISECGNVIIRYPFWVLSNNTVAGELICGYPDFAIECSQGKAITALQSHRYYVTAIDYDNHSIAFVDIQSFSFGAAVQKGFMLNWTRPESCTECELSTGFCGFNQDTKQSNCMCQNGEVFAKNCGPAVGDDIDLDLVCHPIVPCNSNSCFEYCQQHDMMSGYCDYELAAYCCYCLKYSTVTTNASTNSLKSNASSSSSKSDASSLGSAGNMLRILLTITQGIAFVWKFSS